VVIMCVGCLMPSPRRFAPPWTERRLKSRRLRRRSMSRLRSCCLEISCERLRTGMMASRLYHRGHVIPAQTDHLQKCGGAIGESQMLCKVFCSQAKFHIVNSRVASSRHLGPSSSPVPPRHLSGVAVGSYNGPSTQRSVGFCIIAA
jgi:hypothetical protein